MVASEIAKGHTKGETTGKGLKKLAAAMLVAAALLSPSFAWAADTDKVTVNDTSGNSQTVYTEIGANNQFATKEELNGKQDKIGNSLTIGATTITEKSIEMAMETSPTITVKMTRTGHTTTISSDSVTSYTLTGEKGVTDGTTKNGTSVQMDKTVGQNLNALDERITNVKEYVLSETNNNYVSKTDAAVKDGAIVKAANTVGENVALLDKGLSDETNARIWADKSQDKRINEAAAGIASVNTALATQVGILNQQDANEAATRAAADTELNERITNEANAIHETTNQLQSDLTTETTAREAADTALDTRITNVKEYLEKQTSDKYVSKDDAAVQDGAIVKAANTIGDNVTKLDAALAKETAARLGADAAQDKVIKQVNDNAAAGIAAVNTALATQVGILNQNDATERAERMVADAAETAGRVAADTKLVEATNGGLSLDNDNVLQKTKTEISSTGEVTTSKEAATTLILNKGTDYQVKIDSEGVTVGTSSTQMDAEGFTAGGHDYDAAGAALMSDGRIKGAKGAFTVDTAGNVASGNVTSTGTVKGATLTDGIATISNGNINTSGSVTGGTVTSTGNISALGDIHAGGAITGASASIQGALTAGSATITGALTAGGAIQGKSISDGTATMQNGSITGVKNLSAETITTSGNADIGGDLTVKGKLNVDEIDLTKNGIDGDYNVTSSTKVAAGEITSYKKATRTKDGSEKESAIDYDENGTSTWAKSTDADGNWNKSTLTVEGDDVTSKVVDSKGNKNESTQTASASNSAITGTVDGKNYKSYITQNLKNILQGIKEGSNESTVNQTETGIKSTATDGTNTASTNLSNGGFNTYATDGTNKTYTKQTATDIKNTAENGTISNSAKDLVNTASENMTNNVGKNLETTVGGEMKTTVTGKVTEDFKSDLTTTIGGNKSETVAGTSEETVTGKKTETYGGLETTVNGDEKHTVSGSQTNEITGSQTNTIGGDQTTTVTGDSSLTAENINNTARNRITNKALDVETDASSSIVNKVSNEYGSNTSTQLSYQTTEEMSQADGKTASYLRGAAEEKSQLTDGAKKTTIDTIAGQTNTNITDGKNISNNLQNADKIASSVTDGKSTTVVDQKAGSLASSITDGTKVNNTSSTVDKSEQLIKVDDTHFYAETKTVDKAEEALKSGTTLIDIVKDTKTATVSSAVTDGKTITGISQNAKDINLSAADGTIANSAKNINNTATEKLSNSAAEIENKATKSINNSVGDNVSSSMTTNKITESVKNGTKSNTFTKTVDKDINIVTDGTNTSTESQLAGSVNTSLKNGTQSLNNKMTLANEDGKAEDVTKITDTASGAFSSSSQKADSITNTVKDGNGSNVATDKALSSESKLTSGSSVIDVIKSLDDAANPAITSSVTDGTNTSEVKQTASEVSTSAKDISNTATEKITSQIGDGTAVKSEMTADGITNTAEGGTIYNKSKDILNEASGDILNFADGEIGNVATKITNITGNNTVTSDTNGTTFGNTDHSTAIKDGTVTKTTISGNTLETGQATMDYADVMKDLGVRGNATVDGNTTLGKEGADTTLTVNSTSTFNKDVTMKSNATVEKDLTVKGDAIIGTNANNTLTVNSKSTFNNGVTVKGGTTTDTLKVTGTSEFGGAATFNGEVTFKEAVSMDKDLSVGGNVDAASYTVKGTDIKIDENGINAGNQVIKNVGQGDISEGSHDAVSGGQLYETNTRVTGLETRMGTVETRVDKLDNKIDKVGANAAAMANLHPLEFDEDSKWNIAAAVGSSGSETASAVGVFYRPNENVMVNASAAMGTGENMFGGGVSLRLGHGGNKAKEAQMKAAAKENRELRAKVDDLTARMDALLSVLNPNMSKDFPDVPENHWAYEAVSRLAGNGIVEGYEDGKYHGERQMTRYEMAEIIYNALSKGAKAEKKLVEEFRPELQAMAAQKKA